jgi:hypothetical protein
VSRDEHSVCSSGVIDQIVFSSPMGKIETPNAKKRHRRVQHLHSNNSTHNSTTTKSVSNANGSGTVGLGVVAAVDDDADENIFVVVSLDKQWYFEAQSNDERDEWVQAIEQQILCSLQNIESSKAARAAKTGGPSMADFSCIQTIKQTSGNGFCADCEHISTRVVLVVSIDVHIRTHLDPTWASLNLGSLICMDCASCHRNLGTHLSRVRSLELDEWP